MKSFVFPGNIEPEILELGARQIPYMRTAWFSELVRECEAGLLELADCPGGRVIPYTASGTAAMDSCITSFVAACKKALVINGGTFGARWVALCRYYHVPHDELVVPFGGVPDMHALAETLHAGPYDVVLMQHHETSSGALHDLSPVASLCRDRGAFLVVDAIGSFLADEFSMRRQGVDVTVLSSQKGLNLPPGLSFLVLSRRVVESGRRARNCFYYDWHEHLDDLERGQTPYSPATQLFVQLQARLRGTGPDGAARRVMRTGQMADSFRHACCREGWQLSAQCRSNALTGLILPFTVRPMVNALAEKSVFIMPSSVKNMVRVTHTGALGREDYLELVEEIATWQNR